ncbi:MAG: hypothetical protein J0653_04405, partial [Deltaproteobacteria bacterium]|nr:hypothetical protein [Deltaproteobacteria bacterium]
MMYSEWRDELERWPRALPEFEFEPKTTALMIVDLQHYDAHREYGLAKTLLEKFPDMYEYYYNRIEHSIVPNTIKLLRYFRENNLRVIHVTVGPELPDGSDFYIPRRAKDLEKQKAPGAKTLFCKGSFEHSILPVLAPM